MSVVVPTLYLPTARLRKDPVSGRWSEPQGSLHYRWLAVYWKVGTPEPAASFRPERKEIVLQPYDGFFGADARRAFAAAVA